MERLFFSERFDKIFTYEGPQIGGPFFSERFDKIGFDNIHISDNFRFLSTRTCKAVVPAILLHAWENRSSRRILYQNQSSRPPNPPTAGLYSLSDFLGILDKWQETGCSSGRRDRMKRRRWDSHFSSKTGSDMCLSWESGRFHLWAPCSDGGG